jgi:GNAT superfamily N-acetyltransferase
MKASMTSTAAATERLIEQSARNLAEFFTGIGPHVLHSPAIWACDFGSEEVIVNSCANLSPLPDDIAELTARLDDFYGQREGRDWLLWNAWPATDLSAHGYALAGQPPLMIRPPNATPVAIPIGLRIAEVTAPDELAILERGVVAWYPFEHFTVAGPGDLFPARSLGGSHHYFMGYEGDRPVCVAVACLGAGVIGIYCVATSPDARGKGYGGAITDVAAQFAPTLPAVLQSSDMGRPVYERLGFKRIGHFDLWVRARRPAQA